MIGPVSGWERPSAILAAKAHAGLMPWTPFSSALPGRPIDLSGRWRPGEFGTFLAVSCPQARARVCRRLRRLHLPALQIRGSRRPENPMPGPNSPNPAGDEAEPAGSALCLRCCARASRFDRLPSWPEIEFLFVFRIVNQAGRSAAECERGCYAEGFAAAKKAERGVTG
jgi:hypothetical protein